ncbi:hypothetical protein J433_15452 [Corynebacterium glutamicum MT]|uniref:hypothetical protein n=1 Tax=Corynebacterium glutamicum TaxID=1718 RepID=UPI000326F7A8|nr:hypothetical protein [Corynebacterium glutamicum]EOA63186.1 hypothetical protein J433_15452 [Corynebacterium glutamicum MT]
MEDRISCAYCGGLIPPRPDPRGRRAKYCSNACRAAASRERTSKRHADELEAARSQMSSMIVTELEAVERIIRDRGEVPEAMTAIVNAAFRVAVAAQDATPPPPPALNRQQRRASKKSPSGRKR